MASLHGKGKGRSRSLETPLRAFLVRLSFQSPLLATLSAFFVCLAYFVDITAACIEL